MKKTNDKISGIYIITNVINGKQYVGSSNHVKYRLRRHFQLLRDDIHQNPKLQAGYNKHAKQAFTSTIIEEVCVEKLIEREQYYIDTLSPWYNVCQTAGSVLGIKHSQETIQLCIEANKNRKGTHHYGKAGLVQQIDSQTGEVLGTYTSGRHAAEYILNSKGTIKTRGCKISQAAKNGNTAYGFNWKLVKLAQLKQDELLED